jgi:hypothetical protein
MVRMRDTSPILSTSGLETGGDSDSIGSVEETMPSSMMEDSLINMSYL